MCTIKLQGMKFRSFIGHFNEEKDIGDNFSVNLEVKTDCKKAGETDQLKYALDYQRLYAIVKSEMGKKCNLIENAAQRIVKRILEEIEQAESVKIELCKLSPQLGGVIDYVSVITEEKKQ